MPQNTKFLKTLLLAGLKVTAPDMLYCSLEVTRKRKHRNAINSRKRKSGPRRRGATRTWGPSSRKGGARLQGFALTPCKITPCTEPQKGRGGGWRPALRRGRGARGGGVAPAVAPRSRRGALWLSAHWPVRGRLARSEPIPGLRAWPAWPGPRPAP